MTACKHFDAEIGARIKVRRILAGMSQKDVGDAIGTTFQQVQKYENGKNRIAAVRLVALAAVLGVHPSELLLGGEEPELKLRRMDLNLFHKLARLTEEQKLAVGALIAAFAPNRNDGTKG